MPEPGTAVPGWLQRLRRTRPGIATFDDVACGVELLETGPLEFGVIQLPVDRAGRWVAEAVPDQNTVHVVLASTRCRLDHPAGDRTDRRRVGRAGAAH